MIYALLSLGIKGDYKSATSQSKHYFADMTNIYEVNTL